MIRNDFINFPSFSDKILELMKAQQLADNKLLTKKFRFNKILFELYLIRLIPGKKTTS